jgi:hypothetical protein
MVLDSMVVCELLDKRMHSIFRTNILDGYLLKSLDLLPLANQIEILPDRVLIHRCFGDKVCMFTKPGNAHPQVIQEGDTVVLGLRVPACKVQSNAIKEMERLGVKLSHNPHPSAGPGKLTIMHGSSIAHQDTRVVGEVLTAPASSVTDTTVDAMMNFRNTTGEPLGRPYDIVVRATGWNHNVSMYVGSAAPQLQSNGKFARMTHEYESANVPGLFFAGSLAHGKDRGRAVGGVIKGYRHTANALFHILEAKYHQEPWPCTTYQLPGETDAMLSHAMRRINEAPDLYNMVYTLVDGIFFEKAGDWSAKYCEGMPFEYINKEYGEVHRMVRSAFWFQYTWYHLRFDA